MAAVLITRIDGDVDYIFAGDVDVVFVDLDRHDMSTAFPDDLDRDLKALRSLPAEMVWQRELIGKVLEKQRSIVDYIRNNEGGGGCAHPVDHAS